MSKQDTNELVRLLRQHPTPEVERIYIELMIRLGVRSMWVSLDDFELPK